VRFTIAFYLLIFGLAIAFVLWPGACAPPPGNDPTSLTSTVGNEQLARTFRIAMPDCVGKVKWGMSPTKVKSICSEDWLHIEGGNYHFVHYPFGDDRRQIVKFKFANNTLRSFSVSDKLASREALIEAFKAAQDRFIKAYSPHPGIRSTTWSDDRTTLALTRDSARLRLVRTYTARK